MKTVQRKKGFACCIYFTGWEQISLGAHIDLASPNIEIHLPFSFIRIGWLTIGVAGEADDRSGMFGYMKRPEV